jgi:hypothetical protein
MAPSRFGFSHFWEKDNLENQTNDEAEWANSKKLPDPQAR